MFFSIAKSGWIFWMEMHTSCFYELKRSLTPKNEIIGFIISFIINIYKWKINGLIVWASKRVFLQFQPLSFPSCRLSNMRTSPLLGFVSAGLGILHPSSLHQRGRGPVGASSIWKEQIWLRWITSFVPGLQSVHLNPALTLNNSKPQDYQ